MWFKNETCFSRLVMTEYELKVGGGAMELKNYLGETLGRERHKSVIGFCFILFFFFSFLTRFPIPDFFFSRFSVFFLQGCVKYFVHTYSFPPPHNKVIKSTFLG